MGREVLKSRPDAILEFWVGQETPSIPLTKGDKKDDAPERKPKDRRVLCESDLWEPAIQSIVGEITRFGRIGIFCDRKNTDAKEFFCQDRLKTCPYEYKPKDKRAEKSPRLSFFETQVLHHMANEGMADSVEFRRLARKFLRHTKHAHCDTIFFCEAIFGEGKTRKILQHLAGTQMKVVVPSDFVFLSITETAPSQKQEIKRGITIYTEDSLEFTKKRAETILRTKLKDSDMKQD